MPVTKKEKTPYKEYQILKEKASRQRIKFVFYPWPVLVAILFPALVLLLAVLYYIFRIRAVAQ